MSKDKFFKGNKRSLQHCCTFACIMYNRFSFCYYSSKKNNDYRPSLSRANNSKDIFVAVVKFTKCFLVFLVSLDGKQLVFKNHLRSISSRKRAPNPYFQLRVHYHKMKRWP